MGDSGALGGLAWGWTGMAVAEGGFYGVSRLLGGGVRVLGCGDARYLGGTGGRLWVWAVTCVPPTSHPAGKDVSIVTKIDGSQVPAKPTIKWFKGKWLELGIKSGIRFQFKDSYEKEAKVRQGWGLWVGWGGSD